MGYELRRQLRNALGSDVTGLQRAVALEIADDASDDSRESWASLEDLVRWTAAKDANVVRNALKRLGDCGWEFRVPMGVGKDGRTLYAVPGRRLTFRVPNFEGVAPAPSQGATATPKGEPQLPLQGTEGVAPAPSERAGAPTQGAGAPTERAGATPFSSSPHLLNTSTADPRVGDPFDEFWSAYPRKVKKPFARKAWDRAIKSNADPRTVIDAVPRHAAHWRNTGTDIKYVPHPSTWLNGECWNDDLPAALPAAPAQRGGYRDPSERGTF